MGEQVGEGTCENRVLLLPTRLQLEQAQALCQEIIILIWFEDIVNIILFGRSAGNRPLGRFAGLYENEAAYDRFGQIGIRFWRAWPIRRRGTENRHKGFQKSHPELGLQSGLRPPLATTSGKEKS